MKHWIVSLYGIIRYLMTELMPLYLPDINKNHSLIMRGIAIFCIAIHNLLHLQSFGFVSENEVTFFEEKARYFYNHVLTFDSSLFGNVSITNEDGNTTYYEYAANSFNGEQIRSIRRQESKDDTDLSSDHSGSDKDTSCLYPPFRSDTRPSVQKGSKSIIPYSPVFWYTFSIKSFPIRSENISFHEKKPEAPKCLRGHHAFNRIRQDKRYVPNGI